MMPTATTVEPPEHADPWGFGVTEDDQSVRIEWSVSDEPVDDEAPTPTGMAMLKRGRLGPDELEALLQPAASASLPAPVMLLAAASPAAAISTAPALETPATPAIPATPTPTKAAPPVRERAPLRLPFAPDRIGLMALLGAVIVAQAFYIGFTLTGEASARPAGLTPAAPTPVAAAGAAVAPSPALASAVGVLKVDTGLAIAEVRIDGAPAGKTPFIVSDVTAGSHTVSVLFAGGTTIDRAVNVAPGETVALVLEAPVARPVVPAGPVSGWVRVVAPFDVQVFENGALLGTSASDRIMMPAGGHVLELVNTALGFRAVTKAAVLPGRIAALTADVPQRPVSINAQPWAEVAVDGRVLGDTPLANLMLPIGVHRVVFRHPDLGERVETVTVRADGVNRVSADLRR